MKTVALNKELNIDDLKNTTEIELIFDNICDMSCTYCDSSKSTAWALNIRLNGFYNLETSNLHNEIFEFNGELIQKNLVNFTTWWLKNNNQVTVLKINGGEPMLSQYFWRFIHNISKFSYPQLNLIIVTGLSYSPSQIKRLHDLSDKFKSIQIIGSIDAPNGANNFLRDGRHFKIMSNIKHMLGGPTNCFVALQNVLSVFSIWSYGSFIEYNIKLREYSSKSKLDSLDVLMRGSSSLGSYALTSFNSGKRIDPIIPGNLRPFNSIILTSPAFQSILMLPIQLREFLYEDIFAVYTSLENELFTPDKKTIINCLDYIQSAKFSDNLESSRPSMERDLKKFTVEYQKHIDSSLTLSSVFPKIFVDWLDTI